MYANDMQWEIVDAVEEIAKGHGVEMSEIALAWLLSKPVVTAPIVGATKPAHLEAAIKAVDVTLSPDEIQRLEAPYRPHRVLGHR
jgi:aryl-alcohol dehydrogenase-like predicted oxidoreductase